MATTPSTHPLIYKSLQIGSVESPGTVTLSDFGRELEIEEQKAKGVTGSTQVTHGINVANFTATFFLADLDDAAAWDEFQKILAAAQEAPKPRALSAYHPDLVRLKITDVLVKSIGGMTHDARAGMTVAVKFTEYRPAKAKPASKPGADASAKRPTRPDPNREAKAELAFLLSQAKAP